MVKINPLFFVVLIIVFLLGHVFSFSVMFLTLIIHELVHLLFIMKNRIAVSKIVIEPFGISIIADNENIDTVWVYLSAPLFNLAVGGLIFVLNKEDYYLNYFMMTNLALGFFNLIPVVPLDGGRAAELIFGKSLNIISIITSVILVALGCYLVIIQANFSVIIIGSFLLYNSIAEKALEKRIKHYTGLEKRGKLKESLPIVSLAVPKNYPFHKLIKQFRPENYYIVKIIDNGSVIMTLTETQVIQKLISE